MITKQIKDQLKQKGLQVYDKFVDKINTQLNAFYDFDNFYFGKDRENMVLKKYYHYTNQKCSEETVKYLDQFNISTLNRLDDFSEC